MGQYRNSLVILIMTNELIMNYDITFYTFVRKISAFGLLFELLKNIKLMQKVCKKFISFFFQILY